MCLECLCSHQAQLGRQHTFGLSELFFFFMKTAAAGSKVDESSEAEPYGKCAVKLKLNQIFFKLKLSLNMTPFTLQSFSLLLIQKSLGENKAIKLYKRTIYAPSCVSVWLVSKGHSSFILNYSGPSPQVK